MFTLQAIIGLKWLPGIQPGIPRMPCCEALICHSAVRKLIAEGRDRQIGLVI